MLLELLRLAAVLLLLVALPGLLLVNALLPPPRAGLTRLERGVLSACAGIALVMLVGAALGFLPHGERGWFQTAATGVPSVELSLLAVSLLCFVVGLQRGAYPRISARFPRLAQPDSRVGRRQRI